MARSFCLVINPAAANGRAAQYRSVIENALTSAGAAFHIQESRSLDHARAITAGAAQRGEAVVAVGGDGLIGALCEVVAGTDGVLGLIPAGRGNDFARMLGIPAKPSDAVRCLLQGHPRPVDLIGARTAGSPEVIVVGSVYLGLLSEGGEIANASRWLVRGPFGYELAGLRALLSWRPATFSVQVDGRHATGTSGAAGEQRGFFVMVANSAYLAAGKKMAPDADLADGLLDVVLVRQTGKLAFVRAMRKASKGTHVQLSQVGRDQGTFVSISADRAMLVGADGETLACGSPLAAGVSLMVRALPSALNVIAPD
jgi:diacylglycerol kinase (ATP)